MESYEHSDPQRQEIRVNPHQLHDIAESEEPLSSQTFSETTYYLGDIPAAAIGISYMLQRTKYKLRKVDDYLGLLIYVLNSKEEYIRQAIKHPMWDCLSSKERAGLLKKIAEKDKQ